MNGFVALTANAEWYCEWCARTENETMFRIHGDANGATLCGTCANEWEDGR